MTESHKEAMKEWCPLATMELAKCQKSFNELSKKYQLLLEFIKESAENLENPMCREARIVLKEIGEI